MASERGRYANLTKTDGNLLITLTEEGRAEIDEVIERNSSQDGVVCDLIQDHLGNGWEEVRPEAVGALTDDISWDEDGEVVTHLGRVYWHERYQVEDSIEALRGGGLILNGAD